MLFIQICLRKYLLFVSFVDLNSAHAQNKDTECVFNFSESSCPVRKVNKSNNFLLIFTLDCVFVLCNDCYCISIKCDTMSRISYNVDNKRILAYSVTFRHQSFKLFKNFGSKIDLFHLCLISEIDY